jgi:uncharacterized repeat protein (TIGR01451 family)
MTIRSSVVVKNVTNSITGGGLVVESPGTASFTNTILAGNVRGSCLTINSGTITSLGHNLTPCGFQEPTDVQITDSQLFTEVLEEELKDNGGPTFTQALLERGRAVDAGYCPGETTDQRGFARPFDDTRMPNALDGCDIGSYEWQAATSSTRADLLISQAVDKSRVKQGELLTYFVRVQNLGPNDAANVVVYDILSSGVTVYDVRCPKGSCTAPPKGETGTVTWNVGDLLDQGNEVAEIQVTVLVKGKTTITSTASVKSDTADPDPANNSAAITVSVASGSGGKGPKK